MNRIYSYLLTGLAICLVIFDSMGQIGDFITNLPIVRIETGGVTIPDDPRIKATLLITNSGNQNSTLDLPTEAYAIEIETRGNSSLEFPKKGFRLETQDALGNNLNIPLLGLPAENDWILYGPYMDKSLIRNALVYEMSNLMGMYAPRTVFCELMIDGYYWGIYLLTEKIKQDKNRVDIAKLTNLDISGDELTGGYILKVDWDDVNNPNQGWTSVPENLPAAEEPIYFQFDDPGLDNLLQVQAAYIKDFVLNFENVLLSPDFIETKQYLSYIDIGSFVDFMILSEISKNVDAYKRSVFLYKEKDSDGGKLKMGPVWDYDLGFGNVDYSENAQFAPGWMYPETIRMFWFRRLMEDPYFNSRFSCRWLELRSGIFSDQNINQLIDMTTGQILGAVDRNFEQFPILGVYVWPNQFVGNTYTEEVEFLRNWLLDRLAWMDQNLAQECLITSVKLKEDHQPKIFPNPFTDSFVIKWPTVMNREIILLDLHGRLILKETSTDGRFELDGADFGNGLLKEGVYILKLVDQYGNSRTQQIIKRE